ncbi:DUF6233 domain-containing protein [Streptomyces decoyicus]
MQLNLGADQRPVAVHHGECAVGGARARRITRRGAIEALAAGVESCLSAGRVQEYRCGRWLGSSSSMAR